MKKTFYIICGLTAFLFSCGEEEAVPSIDPAQQIWLRARVENAVTMSRAPFDPPAPDVSKPTVTAPDKKHPLKVDVWASTTEWNYAHRDGEDGKNGTVSLHTSANFTAGSEQLLNDAVYPKSNGGDKKPVYFVALHPQGTWTNPKDPADATGQTYDIQKATMTFDGSQDVMFAPQVTGQYSQNVGNPDTPWPTFKFKHLLTWLTVCVKAENNEVAESWGKIKSLKVKCAVGNTVTIDLSEKKDASSDPYDDVNNPQARASFSSGDGVELDFYGANDKKIGFEGFYVTIPHDRFGNVAYVLCPPVKATALDGTDKTAEYILIVETEYRTVEVPVDLMKEESSDQGETTYPCFEGSTMNCHFTLNLTFKLDNIIQLASHAEDWSLGGISSGTISPD